MNTPDGSEDSVLQEQGGFMVGEAERVVAVRVQGERVVVRSTDHARVRAKTG